MTLFIVTNFMPRGVLSKVNSFHLDKTLLTCIAFRARMHNSAGHVEGRGKIRRKKAKEEE
jgi:hypothetical protein